MFASVAAEPRIEARSHFASCAKLMNNHPKLPKGWTFKYLGIGVFGSSKQYQVFHKDRPEFEISVDKPQRGAALTINDHLKYIWRREFDGA